MSYHLSMKDESKPDRDPAILSTSVLSWIKSKVEYLPLPAH